MLFTRSSSLSVTQDTLLQGNKITPICKTSQIMESSKKISMFKGVSMKASLPDLCGFGPFHLYKLLKLIQVHNGGSNRVAEDEHNDFSGIVPDISSENWI